MNYKKVNQSQDMLRQGSAQVVLELLRVALGHSSTCGYTLDKTNWAEVMDIASTQGVLGVCFDGYTNLNDNLNPNERVLMDELMDWLGQVSFMESCYEEHRKVIGQLAHFYGSTCSPNGDSIRMMVLKGYGLSMYYPVPQHRPVGDVDTYNFGLQEFADQMVHDKLGIEIDNSHHHHTVFSFNGVTIENHYDFIAVSDHRSSERINNLLNQLAKKECDTLHVDGSVIYLPHPDFNALFLAKHCAMHFASTEMTLRQLLDWLLFVQKEHDRVDWQALYKTLHDENLHRFVNAMNTIGVKYLGFDATLFFELSDEDKLVGRILNDIFSPEFTEGEDGTLLSGLWVKPRRWWHNRWKHRICYKDDLFSSFVLTLYSKLQKPAHFRH